VEFKIDENLPSEACRILQDAGHGAVSVLDQELGGHPDSDIAIVCKTEGRALITLDTDFGNILAYPPAGFPGIIVIRTKDQAKPTVLNFVHRIVAALQSHSLPGRLWIVENDRMRIRGAE
jgi:predicted nuclease of predicted toxin-antitoxin system